MNASPHRQGRARALRRAAGVVALLLAPALLSASPVGAQTAPKPTPNLITTGSPTVPVGGQIFANANLLGVSNPTGTLVFKLYGPGDTTCATEIFTSVVPVTGTSVNSERFTTSVAGTYRWTSTYSGDATYNGAGPTPCSGGSEYVIVDKVRTVLYTKADPPSGGTISDAATLTGGFNPTGTLTFVAHAPSDAYCMAPAAFTSVVAVNGNGTYHSQSYRPVVSGTYKWRVSYTGDANNRGVSWTACLDPNQAVTVNVAQRTASDYDGDSKADPAAYRPSNGMWYLDRSSAPDTAQYWGMPGDAAVPGDYDGDRRADFAVYRPNTGMWYVLTASGANLSRYWGAPGDVPVPGDYDGDGTVDYAVFRPASNTWFVSLAATGAFRSQYWGAPGDVPVPGDYDADGKADYAVYRPASGTWYVLTAAGVSRSQYWGAPGDVPVPADYDGDGTVDHAVYRPVSGTWYALLASGAIVSQYWGAPGDVPVPGDYDGDGKADYAVFRPAGGAWYAHLSTGRDTVGQQGAWGDMPPGLPYAVWNAYFNPAR